MSRVHVGPANACLVYKPYPYEHGIEIQGKLKELGYVLLPLDQKERALDHVVSKAKAEKKHIIVVEDGGYLTPLYTSGISMILNSSGVW
jgi:hypothetical protein